MAINDSERFQQLKLIPANELTFKEKLEKSKLKSKLQSKFQHEEEASAKASSRKFIELYIENLNNQKNPNARNTFSLIPGISRPAPTAVRSVRFDNEFQAMRFLQNSCKTQKFRVFGPNNQLLAVSNGRGALQHSDGRAFNSPRAFAELSNMNGNINGRFPTAQNANLNFSQNSIQMTAPGTRGMSPPQPVAYNRRVAPAVAPRVQNTGIQLTAAKNSNQTENLQNNPYQTGF